MGDELELGHMIFGNAPAGNFRPPRGAEDMLYDLSETLGKRDPAAQSHGLFGGEWGYGQHFENDVFEMHPYYWGDCDCGFDERDHAWSEAHDHADDCYQTELRRRKGADPEPLSDVAANLAKEWGLSRYGCAVHCTCSHDREYETWRQANDHAPRCPTVLPNFHHKPSGLMVSWYKYIGRDMTSNRELTTSGFAEIYQACLASIADGKGMSVDSGKEDGRG